jgi:hypothetical protein
MKNWDFYEWAIATTIAVLILAIAYGIYTDIPGTAIYVPGEKAIRL